MEWSRKFVRPAELSDPPARREIAPSRISSSGLSWNFAWWLGGEIISLTKSFKRSSKRQNSLRCPDFGHRATFILQHLLSAWSELFFVLNTLERFHTVTIRNWKHCQSSGSQRTWRLHEKGEWVKWRWDFVWRIDLKLLLFWGNGPESWWGNGVLWHSWLSKEGSSTWTAVCVLFLNWRVLNSATILCSVSTWMCFGRPPPPARCLSICFLSWIVLSV